MTTVFGWAADPGGRGHYRVELPMQALAARGVDATYGRILSREIIEQSDVVIGQLVIKERASKIWAEACKDPDTLAVYEIDDDLFQLHPGHAGSAAADFYSGANLDRMRANIKMADLVTVTTHELAHVVGKYNSNVRILPNYIDESTLTIPQRHAGDSLVNPWPAGGVAVGYQAATFHARDFLEAWPGVSRAIARNPRAWYVSFGENYAAGQRVPVAMRDRLASIGWVIADWERYYRHLSLFDIGLAPLAWNPFNASKSHLKVLEYMALGIPAVASHGEAYADLIRGGETGFLIPDGATHLWEKHVRNLINDDVLRQSMGDAAWRLASQYTIQGNVDQWADAYGIKLDAKVSQAA